jgi:hypothetical protein
MAEILPGQLIDDRNVGGHSWQKRRRLMFSVVGFSMACIAWAMYKDSGSAVHLTAVQMGFGTLISITGTYVFGAVWNDRQ